MDSSKQEKNKDHLTPSNSLDLPKKYKFKELEAKWKLYWQENKIYKSSFKGDNVYSIDTPPPTVSGAMHLGHAFSYVQGDIIARFKRMKGFTIFYPFGTDDNGLPTELLIERTKKVSSKHMSRPDFVKLCHETIKEIKPDFVQPWKDLAISADYETSYSTIDMDATRVSQKSFIDLHKKGLVYKKETPTTWCVKCQTAIAQAEFENIEKKSTFNDISFHDEEGNELIIATTRPEMIPACVAIFAHPDDERYKYLQGKSAVVPLFNYKVPILFDKSVEIDKGTGLMMCCTFGDKEDVEKWFVHKLELRQIFEKDGRLNDLAGDYAGMKIIDARKAIIEALKESGDLKNQTQIVHNANAHDKCGTEIEFMKTSQWFVNVLDHKERLVKAADDITWHPAHMKVRYVHWVENLNWDWCISRQRHFGVPFPVWYEKDTENIIVADESDLPIDPSVATPASYKGDPKNLVAEKDVLDTWATSSVTPQIALGWGKTSDADFNNAMPMTLRLQAHDIIRTWTFYTIVKALYNNEKLPWTNIMVSGFVQDRQGRKMSKSKGNGINPLKLMDFFGSDAMRLAASSVKLGEDLPFQDKYLDTGKRTAVKIFNASKFVHMHLEDFDGSFDYKKLIPIDKWLLSEFQLAIKETTEFLEEYEFAKARAVIEKFFWQKLCDNYLEIAKDRLYKPEIYGDDKRLSGQMVLYKVLLDTLKLFAPYVPYITEEVYSWKFKDDAINAGLYKEHKSLDAKSIHTSSWPEYNESFIDMDAIKAGNLACYVIGQARKLKSEAQVSQKHEIDLLTIPCMPAEKELLDSVLNDIKMTISAKEVVYDTTIETEMNENVALTAKLAPKEEKTK